MCKFALLAKENLTVVTFMILFCREDKDTFYMLYVSVFITVSQNVN